LLRGGFFFLGIWANAERNRKLHTELNRLVIARLALALPPHADSPAQYRYGLGAFARVYYAFEAVWLAQLEQLPPSTAPAEMASAAPAATETAAVSATTTTTDKASSSSSKDQVGARDEAHDRDGNNEEDGGSDSGSDSGPHPPSTLERVFGLFSLLGLTNNNNNNNNKAKPAMPTTEPQQAQKRDAHRTEFPPAAGGFADADGNCCCDVCVSQPLSSSSPPPRPPPPPPHVGRCCKRSACLTFFAPHPWKTTLRILTQSTPLLERVVGLTGVRWPMAQV
jgi:hypothetical protein